MNKEELSKILGNLVVVSEHGGVLIINSKFFSPVDDEDYVVGLKEENGEFILSDMGKTYARLLKRGFELEDEIKDYVKEVSEYFFVTYSHKTKEFLIRAKKENLIFAYTYLLQSLIFVVNLDLQMEEIEDKE